MGIMITYHGYSNGYKSPVYNAHKTVGAHYAWQNMVAMSSGFSAAIRVKICFFNKKIVLFKGHIITIHFSL